jgi:hypothetical protein
MEHRSSIGAGGADPAAHKAGMSPRVPKATLFQKHCRQAPDVLMAPTSFVPSQSRLLSLHSSEDHRTGSERGTITRALLARRHRRKVFCPRLTPWQARVRNPPVGYLYVSLRSQQQTPTNREGLAAENSKLHAHQRQNSSTQLRHGGFAALPLMGLTVKVLLSPLASQRITPICHFVICDLHV